MMKYQLVNVDDGHHKGWLNVKLTNYSNFMIPQGIIVEQINNSNNNLYMIMEGLFAGAVIFLPKKYLVKYIQIIDNTDIILDINLRKILIGNKFFDVTLDDSFKSIENISISIPDYPHSNIPNLYINEKIGGSRFAESWFNLTSDNESNNRTDKYFHFGSYSKGCITFLYKKQTDVSNWNYVYNFLITRRTKPGICSSIKVI